MGHRAASLEGNLFSIDSIQSWPVPLVSDLETSVKNGGEEALLDELAKHPVETGLSVN